MTLRITRDLPASQAADWGIRTVPMYIQIGSRSYLDEIDMTRAEFYRQLPHFPEQPTTAVPSIDKFREGHLNKVGEC